MKILIELPTWLGDTVMVSPAVELILKQLHKSSIVFLGSQVSLDYFADIPINDKTFLLLQKNNFVGMVKQINNFGPYDYFFSFRGSHRTKILKIFVNSKNKFQFSKNKTNGIHQVEKYLKFIELSLKVSSQNKTYLKSYGDYKTKSKKKSNLPYIGINPGAEYGGAKRWSPKKYCEIISHYKNSYFFVIFGVKHESYLADEIASLCKKKGLNNYINLCGKTSLKELIKEMNKLDLFITGDSGPMHIAAALKLPTVAIFGPTSEFETSQWKNEKSIIISKKIKCRPCMRRECPLGHQRCMKDISAEEVIQAIEELIVKI